MKIMKSKGVGTVELMGIILVLACMILLSLSIAKHGDDPESEASGTEPYFFREISSNHFRTGMASAAAGGIAGGINSHLMRNKKQIYAPVSPINSAPRRVPTPRTPRFKIYKPAILFSRRGK